METPALAALRRDAALASAAHAVRLTLSDQAVRVLSQPSVESVVLTTESKTNQPILVVHTTHQRIAVPVTVTPAVMRVLEANPQIPMQLQVTDSGEVVLTAQVQRPEPTLVVLRGAVTERTQTPQAPKNPTVSNPLPQAVSAVSQVTPERVQGALLNQGPLYGDTHAPRIPFDPPLRQPAQLVRAVVDSLSASHLASVGKPAAPEIQSQLGQSLVGIRSSLGVIETSQPIGGARAVLIPDVSPAIPRPIAPDALPAQIPIKQPIASELGLKAGQVVQALIASSRGQQHMQFGNQQIPLPQGVQLPQGDVTMRVVQTAQGLVLAPQVASAQPQAAQSAAVSGLSAALASVIAKPSTRPVTQSLFAAGGLESQLASVGLSDEARLLQTNRMSSQQLSGQQIAAAVKFGGLMNEKAIAEGIGFQGGMLKPWLRQLLRLLPHQSELSLKLGDLIGELESFQLESLPQSGSRDHGLSALLLFRDQPPVELIFERHEPDDDDRQGPLWVVNLHTSLESLGDVWLRSGFTGSAVEMMFWAADPRTASLAQRARLDLEEALSEHGLTVKSLQIFDIPRPGHEHLSPGGLPHTDVSA